MAKRIAVYGTAGTGKTTWLINQLEQDALEDRAVLFYTFSTSASKEIKQRLENKGIELNKFYKKLSGTIHSLAFGEVFTDYSEAEYIDKVPYKFLREHHIPYSNSVFDTAKKGDLFVSGLTYAIHRAKSIEPSDLYPYFLEYQKRYGGLNAVEMEVLYRRYLKWKQEKKLKDFNDILVEFLNSEKDPYPADKVYVDEAQDLSPLLYDLVTTKIEANEYYFIGDPLQNVYESLLGSDPNIFLSNIDDEILLDVGHRVPQSIYNYVLKESRPDKHLYELYSKVRHPEGGVLKTHSILGIKTLLGIIKRADYLGLVVAILLPKNRHVIQVARALLRYGVLPQAFKERSPIKVASLFIEVFLEIQYTGTLSTGRINELKRYLPQGTQTDHILTILESPVFPPEYKKSAFTEFLLNSKILPLERNYSPLESIYTNVYIDTIHAAKGREADIVVVLDPRAEATRRLLGLYQFRIANRLFFVGGTRTKNELHITKAIEGVKL